jgi:GDP-mannose 6-dehydrogenase
MKIAIFGLGYVGLTAAGCLASQGHHVLGLDVNEHKILQLRSGQSPISEPGLDALLQRALADGLLQVESTLDDGLADRDVAIVCVGTPSAPDGAHDMSFIAEVTRQIASAASRNRVDPLTVAYRSTMKPGSIETLIMPIFEAVLGDDIGAVEVVYNPEFLRESVAVKDFFAPPKIVVGTRDGQPSAKMLALNAGITATVYHTDYRVAEFTKFADNTFHAVKVAFANELGRVCLKLGVSASKVHEIFISDTKLNISPYYMRPGGAFGGSCLPKDVRALQHMSRAVDADTFLINSLMNTNDAHKKYLYEHSVDGLNPGDKVLLIGLAFKSDTDDLRESPNVDLAVRLLEAGYALRIYDPSLNPAALIGQNLSYISAHLASVGALLVDKATAEAGGFDRVIDTTGRRGHLTLGEVDIVDIHSLT